VTHIQHNVPGHELNDDHLHQHIGYHAEPNNQHRISIHHNDGRKSFYKTVFDTAEKAKSHVKSHFKFTDLFPKVTSAYEKVSEKAGKAYDYLKDIDFAGHVARHGDTVANVADNFGFPEFAQAARTAAEAAKGYKEITDFYHEDLSGIKNFDDFKEKFPKIIDFGKEFIEKLPGAIDEATRPRIDDFPAVPH
jgi:hypothetical protein